VKLTFDAEKDIGEKPKQFDKLETVELYMCNITEKQMRSLYIKQPKLTLVMQARCTCATIDIESTNKAARGFNDAIKFMGFTEVKAKECKDLSNLSMFSDLDTLEKIDVSGCDISNFNDLPQTCSLKSIIANNTKFSSFEGLEKFEFLNELRVQNTLVDKDVGLEKLRNLDILDIRGTEI